MDDTFVTTVYVILGDLERALQLPIKYKLKMTPTEILTVAVVAAKYFHNHPEMALCLMDGWATFGSRSASRASIANSISMQRPWNSG